ncbi:hypothetical protein N7471_011744 [Penicillium samsonianum]|uniref:uncharacterized protein n=1 Tax=Penicillium samsonianum TaxID=1882272 RepID=UPI002548F2B4|nr:uncharacterized protein N7471_011744 [Penicillium samsonianum]KAJ6124427.1 hypothetical protein N7471_011744 [Penicillium samsonianum]
MESSPTKLMTTVAIMICVDHGQISIDDDITPILPDLCALLVLDGVRSEGQCLIKPRAKSITLRLLISHQSGCGYHPSPRLARWARQNGKTNSVFDNDFEGMKTYPLFFELGEGWTIARINNTTLEEFMRSNIWEPLVRHGLSDLLSRVAPRHDGPPRQMYDRIDDKGLERGAWLSQIPAQHNCGGPGPWSTPRDWTKFLGMVLADRGSILSKASIDQISNAQTIGSNDLQELLTGPLCASLRSKVDMDAGRIGLISEFEMAVYAEFT